MLIKIYYFLHIISFYVFMCWMCLWHIGLPWWENMGQSLLYMWLLYFRFTYFKFIFIINRRIIFFVLIIFFILLFFVTFSYKIIIVLLCIIVITILFIGIIFIIYFCWNVQYILCGLSFSGCIQKSPWDFSVLTVSWISSFLRIETAGVFLLLFLQRDAFLIWCNIW